MVTILPMTHRKNVIKYTIHTHTIEFMHRDILHEHDLCCFLDFSRIKIVCSRQGIKFWIECIDFSYGNRTVVEGRERRL